MSCDSVTHPWNHHHNPDSEHVHHPQRTLWVPIEFFSLSTLSPRQPQNCFLLQCIGLHLYKWTHTWSGVFHSALCLWDSFTMLQGSMVHSFILLSSVPLHGLHHSCLNHSPIDEHFFLPVFGYCEWSCYKYLHTSVWTYVFIILRREIVVMSFWKVRKLWLREVM